MQLFDPRTLVDHLYVLGICIPYLRVLEVTKYLYEKLRLSYDMNVLFLPQVLRKGVFTVLAKDNIDKNAKCTFAQSHYHGVSISILQFLSETSRGCELPSTPEPQLQTSSNKLAPLPKDYSHVKAIPYHASNELIAP